MWVVLSLTSFTAIASAQTTKYPPLENYLMARDAEIGLARSAAPEGISSRATVKVLTRTGYEIAHQGENGFVCLVMRGWSGPTYTPSDLRAVAYDAAVRAPICFDTEAVRTVLPYYELKTKLGMAGKTPDEIASAVDAAYKNGDLPKRNSVAFGYMWSADQFLGSEAGHWHPHMMVYSPNYRNAMLGDNPFGSTLPAVTDDAGTPFAIIVIPVDDKLAVKASGK
jgi:hypothetical protein